MTDDERDAALFARMDGWGGDAMWYPSQEDMRFLRRRLEEARAQQKWQPIETAPKGMGDEEFILMWLPDDASRWIARWQGDGWFGIDEYGLRRDSVAERREPTHWQPLPQPPAPAQEKLDE